jgi:hypothetical protein
MNDETFVNLITFWRNVEALSPQQIPKKAPDDRSEPTCDWDAATCPPWLDSGFKRHTIPPSKAWRYSVYAATYDRNRFIELLEQRLGKQPDVFEERAAGQSCVFSLAFDENGRPLVETFMISMAAWAYGIIETWGLEVLSKSDACDTSGLQKPAEKLNIPPSNSGFPGFDRQLERLRDELAWRLGHLPEDQPVDQPWFSDFVQRVIDTCKLTKLVDTGLVHRVKAVQVRRPKMEDINPKSKSEDDFLNSFFIKDLNRLISNRLANTGDSLRRFLEPPSNMTKADLREDRRRALDFLHPQNFPEGCWPAEYPLVWSQQIAINAIWKDLSRTGGTFAVNGPPGTGKTTILRDIVAAIIVDRAKVLAARGGSLLGDRRTIDVGERTIPYYLLDPKLSGFSIVVASSNNGAVENISLELPKQDAIHGVWAGDVDVYRDIAGALLDEPAWAMIAGRLGNKANRTDFSNRFWWQKTGDNDKVAGLRERLTSINLKKANPEPPWQKTVDRFHQALDDEQIWRKRLSKMQGLPGEIVSLNRDNSAAQAKYAGALDEQNVLQQQCEKLMERITEAGRNIELLKRQIENQKAIKPGFLEWLSTFGKSHREWRKKLIGLMEQLEGNENADATLQRKHRDLKKTLTRMAERIAQIQEQVRNITQKIAAAEGDLVQAKSMLGDHWPDITAPEHDQERSSPWAYHEWRSARIRVFLAAMNLHRAFIEENARKMRANLGLAMDMLGGKVPDPKMRAMALESLTIVCPVISTTFASVATLFGDLGPESIGWLLIDEAGQATPQAAAGSIWRALRVVVVGDPLQLEPVITLPRKVEASLAACNGNIASRWHPSRTSVQILADQTTPIGTTMGEGADALWVGAPLRVHRRCDDPMFSISNDIAYDGLMVHQKKPSSFNGPPSAWYHVAKSVANGNWLPAEGEVLQALLRDLLNKHQVAVGDIFLVSPFREVVRNLHKIGRKHHFDSKRVGTVHTTQGKEAGVVILVLGGGTAGARDWAASKPNLLNVAASRAKARLYVIGDRNDWSKRRFFDVLAEKMFVSASSGPLV